MQSTSTKPLSMPQTFSCCGLSGLGSEEFEVLKELDLTSRQARVYLALLKIGVGKAKAVADVSLVNRQEIYRILDELQQIGLVQRNITTPTTFRAMPLADVVKMLLEQKTKQLSFIRQKAKQLTKQHPTYLPVEPDDKPCLGTIFEADRGKKYCQAIQASSQNIDIISSWKRFKQLTALLETQLKNALQKGIDLRIATEKPPNHLLPDWIINAQVRKENRSLELKFFTHPPAAALAIFDHTTAAIAFHPNNSLTKGPDLWTTNLTLIALSQTYFNSMWTQITGPQI